MAEPESPADIAASDEFVETLSRGLLPVVHGWEEAALADLLTRWRRSILERGRGSGDKSE